MLLWQIVDDTGLTYSAFKGYYAGNGMACLDGEGIPVLALEALKRQIDKMEAKAGA